MLDKYASSAKLLRAYGRFLEDVRSNPWAALRYYAEADRLELESRETRDAGAEGCARRGLAGSGPAFQLGGKWRDTLAAALGRALASRAELCLARRLATLYKRLPASSLLPAGPRARATATAR